MVWHKSSDGLIKFKKVKIITFLGKIYLFSEIWASFEKVVCKVRLYMTWFFLSGGLCIGNLNVFIWGQEKSVCLPKRDRPIFSQKPVHFFILFLRLKRKNDFNVNKTCVKLPNKYSELSNPLSSLLNTIKCHDGMDGVNSRSHRWHYTK